jgi:hypothetical protein
MRQKSDPDWPRAWLIKWKIGLRRSKIGQNQGHATTELKISMESWTGYQLRVVDTRSTPVIFCFVKEKSCKKKAVLYYRAQG